MYYNLLLIYIFFFFFTYYSNNILALWSKKTSKGSLSKVVQRVRNYLQLDFQKDWSSTSGVMANIRDGIIIRTSFFLSSFSVPSFLTLFEHFGQMKQAKEA